MTDPTLRLALLAALALFAAAVFAAGAAAVAWACAVGALRAVESLARTRAARSQVALDAEVVAALARRASPPAAGLGGPESAQEAGSPAEEVAPLPRTYEESMQATRDRHAEQVRQVEDRKAREAAAAHATHHVPHRHLHHADLDAPAELAEALRTAVQVPARVAYGPGGGEPLRPDSTASVTNGAAALRIPPAPPGTSGVGEPPP